MISVEDISSAIDDYALRCVSNTIRDCLVALGVTKHYKIRKHKENQEEKVFFALKRSLEDNNASIFFDEGKKPSPTHLIINPNDINRLVGEEKL